MFHPTIIEMTVESNKINSKTNNTELSVYLKAEYLKTVIPKLYKK